MDVARALLNPLRGPLCGPDEIGFGFHWASIQQGESEALNFSSLFMQDPEKG
jgi:hypothetical protein